MVQPCLALAVSPRMSSSLCWFGRVAFFDRLKLRFYLVHLIQGGALIDGMRRSPHQLISGRDRARTKVPHASSCVVGTPRAEGSIPSRRELGTRRQPGGQPVPQMGHTVGWPRCYGLAYEISSSKPADAINRDRWWLSGLNTRGLDRAKPHFIPAFGRSGSRIGRARTGGHRREATRDASVCAAASTTRCLGGIKHVLLRSPRCKASSTRRYDNVQ
jgi:hypothetical protein